MRLTKKLQQYLNRIFKKDPVPALALSIAYSGSGMTWQVRDGFLATVAADASGQSLSIDLSQYTIAQLGAYLLSQPGYSVSYLAPPATLGALSALSLLDASGDISQPGGGNLFVYTDSAYAFLDAAASELELAKQQIKALPNEMSTASADTIWLDMLGTYFNVPRLPSEPDSSYGPRIIATVLRPQSNNVAIEMAIEAYTGQIATVTDVVLPGVTGPVFNADYEFNGAIEYSAVNTPVYGLFDVTYGYDLLTGQDLTTFQQIVVQLVNLLRAAGTHMRSIALTGSVLTDALTPPTDSFSTIGVAANFNDALNPPTDAVPPITVSAAPFSDTLTPPTDSASMTVNYNYQYNGIRRFDGSIQYVSGESIEEPLA